MSGGNHSIHDSQYGESLTSGQRICLREIRRELDLPESPTARSNSHRGTHCIGYMALMTKVIGSQSMVGKNRASNQIPQKKAGKSSTS